MNNKSGLLGLAGVIFAAILLVVVKNVIPSLFRKLMILAIIVLVLVLLLVAVVLYFAFKKPKEKKNADNDAKAILTKGRQNLMELRRYSMKMKHQQVRKLNDEICGVIDKILQTLSKQPEDIPAVRKFFNYYLPTLGGILEKFTRVENSGIPSGETAESVISCLTDIKSAMEKQYENLFEDDKLDLSVEMEVLTAVCKRDGLLEDDVYKSRKSGDFTL